ncbi:MAG: glycosyltransferase family 4 protein [Acidiferrobacter sp.]
MASDKAGATTRLCVYVPHGTVPDRRGFSPAIVAWQFARRIRSVETTIICAAENNPPGHETVEGLDVYRLARRRAYERLRKWRVPDWRPLCRRVRRLGRVLHPDILHVHQLEFPVAHWRRHQSGAVIVHAHVLCHDYVPQRGSADAYVAVSDHVRRSLMAQGYPEGRIVTVRNGVDTTLFAPATADQRVFARLRLNLPEHWPVLAFVGRKHDVKGFPVFLQVAERILRSGREVSILAIGAEPTPGRHDVPDLAAAARRQWLGRQPHYHDLGAVPQHELAALYKAIDVTLLPTWDETQGMAMIESLAAGCLTLSTRVGGIPETITHGRTGYLFDDPRDIDNIFAMTEDTLDHLAQRDGVRGAARAFAVSELDWGVAAGRLSALYGAHGR